MNEKQVILIVDDTPQNLRLLGEMLEREGYEVQVANNGPEALEVARATPMPDLILLDIMMPGMDGYEVCRRLKSTAETESIPVIFISALGMVEQKIEGFRVGGVDYITKPFQTEEVVARVKTHIQLVQRKREIELKNLEISEANRNLESFSYSISHDLRAPLRHSSSFVRILLSDYGQTMEEEAKTLLDRVAAGCDRMELLIDDLLNFSRLSRQPVNKSPFETSELVQQVVEELDLSKRQPPVELFMHDLPRCQADPQLIRQVFQNLIANALKFSAKVEQPNIEIGTMKKEGQTVYFVKDNGVGFDMKYTERLFGAFQRLHSYEEFPGTGIGLFLVHNIISRHGGKIWSEAALGAGATFFFTL